MLQKFWKLMYFPKFDDEYCLKISACHESNVTLLSFASARLCWDSFIAKCIWYAHSSTEVSAVDMWKTQSCMTTGHTERKDMGSHCHIKHTGTVSSWDNIL